MPYEKVDLTSLVNITYEGYDSEGTAIVSFDETKLDELMAKLREDYDNAWFHTTKPEDGDYAIFRQSLVCNVQGSVPDSSVPVVGGIDAATSSSMGLSNGSVVTVNCNYNSELAEKLKLEITSSSGQFTVGGLPSVTVLSVDEVFEGLNVAFEGISPNISLVMENSSTNPLVSQMKFEIVEPKEYYATGDAVQVRAVYTDEMCMETKYVVDVAPEECIKEFVAKADAEYLTDAEDLPSSILEEAVEAGKKAFKDANEYGVRIYCEANLVPVYINKKATFEYGTPNYVSSYFKTVFPEKAGELGLSYNDLDIIYDVKITQADGVSCKAFGAVRFSNIIKNSDGTYSYDFSNPKILSESYFSDRVKKNVTESYKTTHNVERVYR